MVAAIIVAAGCGTRMGQGTDKLFLELAGRPVVGHTWARFDGLPEIDEIVLVVRDGRQGEFKELGAALSVAKPHQIVEGGAERQDSVWNGLMAVSSGVDIVAIQDGARPCTDAGLIVRTIDAARKTGAAVAAGCVTDTIKESDAGGFVARHINRDSLRAVQTPQTFQLKVICHALEAVRDQAKHVTDDTAACELIGQPVKLVESDVPNPKVTTASDLSWIEQLLRG
ncbi:MAG: 2-C-methyl-D-erythritol 4-phosphate cytidylyltransferase [Verrucomicrobiota bacterium]|jgi:2-C-methyl-D-erythritol 4-phosphate cytidylyltransferase|nr:2-C-methyl-D-erythritol 4-phosphate cytidylyltransferase [Verrucomicrobiota bacterium]